MRMGACLKRAPFCDFAIGWRNTSGPKASWQLLTICCAAKRLLLKEGSAVDATLVAAPSSTKNNEGKRDPEMHSSKKGNQWYFGMKAHIGVDADSGLVHTVRGTAGHVADVTEGSSHAAWRGSRRVCRCGLPRR